MSLHFMLDPVQPLEYETGLLSLSFYAIIESNTQKTFVSVVLCTNVAAVTSDENHL